MGVMGVTRVGADVRTSATAAPRVLGDHRRIACVVVGKALPTMVPMAGAELSCTVGWLVLDVAIVTEGRGVLFDAVESVAFAAIGVGVCDMLVALYNVLLVNRLTRG